MAISTGGYGGPNPALSPGGVVLTPAGPGIIRSGLHGDRLQVELDESGAVREFHAKELDGPAGGSHAAGPVRADHAVDTTGLKCADLVDAMGRLHRHRCHILDLVSPTPGRVLFGPAVTISYFPSCSVAFDLRRYNFANLFDEAVGDDPSGKVLVLASNGYADTSMAGGTKLLRLQASGCAGVITDGRLRDFDELADYDFAAYCSGETTRWGGDLVTPYQANVPVVVGRVAVMPGQYVFADSSGAVVIPDGQVEEVIAGARAVEAEDEQSRSAIQREGARAH